LRKPFLKWAGGKTRLLPELLPYIGTPNTFVDVFCGGGSVSLNVECKKLISNDINSHLIGLYNHVRYNDPHIFTEYFKDSNCTKETYIELRGKFNSLDDGIEKSKLFVYLNKHSFNGLTRYNRNGFYNVPFGRVTKSKEEQDGVTIIKENISLFNEASISALQHEISSFKEKMIDTNFTCLSFDSPKLYENLTKGDVVYFDPPYIPLNDTAYFTDYFSGGFAIDEQTKLASMAEKLSSQGVRVIVSNSQTETTEKIFEKGTFNLVEARRAVGAASHTRKMQKEYIIVYE